MLMRCGWWVGGDKTYKFKHLSVIRGVGDGIKVVPLRAVVYFRRYFENVFFKFDFIFPRCLSPAFPPSRLCMSRRYHHKTCGHITTQGAILIVIVGPPFRLCSTTV